jgi:hypothetical protein
MKTMDVKNNHGELGWMKYMKVDVIIIHVK